MPFVYPICLSAMPKFRKCVFFGLFIQLDKQTPRPGEGKNGPERRGKEKKKKRKEGGKQNDQRLQPRNLLIALWLMGLSLHRRRHGRCTKKYTSGQPLVERTVSVAPSGGTRRGRSALAASASPPQAPLLKLTPPQPPNQTQLGELRRFSKESAPEDT